NLLAQPSYCRIVIAKLQPGETTSRVLSQQCSNQPLAISSTQTQLLMATSHMQPLQPTLPLQVGCPLFSTHLMRWWADIQYSGSFTDVCGRSGPCDSSGYGFSYVGDSWNDRISSFQVFNHCTYTRAYW